MTKHFPEDIRRAQLQRAARALFARRGYEGAHVEDIAKKAGLSKGAFYRYYTSKEEIFRALVMAEAGHNPTPPIGLMSLLDRPLLLLLAARALHDTEAKVLARRLWP